MCYQSAYYGKKKRLISSVCVCVYCKTEFTNLCKLQSVEGIGWIGEFEELFGHDPGLQSFQFAGCQVGGVMPDQVSLELIRQEVDVDRHRMSHGIIPTSRKMSKLKFATPVKTFLLGIFSIIFLT